jgi:hypothetical protein
VPNAALLSPLTIPYFVLPTWLAPAYEKLLEIIVSVGGCVLFLRRLGVSRPAAVVGGLVFAGSAFMVVWLNFPQTQVAAFIPAVFWTVERSIQKARLRDAALISLPVAAMLLGGFPAVAGYTLLTVGCYALVRVLAQHRAAWRRAAALLLAVGGGLIAGVGLAMFELLPFLGFYRTWLIEGRGQDAAAHLDPVSLVTAVAPWALGTVNPNRPPDFFVGPNLPEAMSYIGAGALVLALVAAAMPRRGRAALPRGAWLFLAVVTLVWSELIYLGGPPLAALQYLPGVRELFASNFIGRSRSVLGFLLAVLAAVGLELLLRRRDRVAATGRYRWLWPVALAAGVGSVAAFVIWTGRRLAIAAGSQRTHGMGNAVRNYDRQILLGGGLTVLALTCCALLWHTGQRAAFSTRRGQSRAVRFGAAALLPLIIASQGLYFVKLYYPTSGRGTFYPVTDTQQYLAENLGQQRFASSGTAMVMGTNGAYRLRSVNGHTFINEAFAQLVRGMSGDPIAYPTHLDFGSDITQATSPILDRLGTKYFVASPLDPVFGRTIRTPSDGGTVTLQPDQPVTLPTVTGRLRAVGFTPTGDVPVTLSTYGSTDWVDAVVRDATGTEVTHARRLTGQMASGTDFLIPTAADDVADDTRLTVTLTLHAPVPVSVAATGGAIASSTVSGAEDGLRLVYAGSSVIYQRLDALPRIRWASRTVVETDQDSRIRMLASGTVAPDTVVLSTPGPAADNAQADGRVADDGTDVITVQVDAHGAGYLVVADADQTGWSATVDGTPAALVAADQGLVAVAVPAGTHSVSLRFTAPFGTAGGWIAGSTAFVVLLTFAGGWWLDRRRARTANRDRSSPLGAASATTDSPLVNAARDTARSADVHSRCA